MLILASTSPRRIELIKKITKDFIVVSPDIDERAHRFSLSTLPMELSKLKAYSVKEKYPNNDVLACDTIVILDKQVIGKPKDDEDAKRILHMLSNKKHIVISGYTYLGDKFIVTRSVRTDVYMNELSDELIDEYVAKGFSKGKAGAYGIQDAYNLVKAINGSYDNVMGLPTEDIIAHINR